MFYDPEEIQQSPMDFLLQSDLESLEDTLMGWSEQAEREPLDAG